MTAEFIRREYAAPGFEAIVDGNEVQHWGLWFNVSLSDNPDAWGERVHRLNALQRSLDNLSEGQRRVRAHMAEYCRRDSSFPESVELLCREIAHGDIDPDGEGITRLGCEGRMLLDRLGVTTRSQGDSACGTAVRGYAAAVSAWREGREPETPLDRRVALFLGEPIQATADALSALASELHSESMTRQVLREAASTCCVGARSEEVLEGPPHPVYCLVCDDWATESPRCACAPARVLDAALLSVGPWADRDAMAGAFRSYIEEYNLAYALGLNAWLTGKDWAEELWPETSRVLNVGDASALAGRLGAILGLRGSASPERVWLVGCLLQTIAANQRWHKAAELLDVVPQATSWLDVPCEGATCL